MSIHVHVHNIMDAMSSTPFHRLELEARKKVKLSEWYKQVTSVCTYVCVRACVRAYIKCVHCACHMCDV